MPTPAARASRGPAKWTGRPSSTTRPASGAWSPARILPSVLLPAPFSPQRAWHDPRRTSKLTPSSASTPGKALLTRSKRRIGSSTRVLRQVEVLLGHVGEAPVLELPRPLAQVVLRDPHQLHRDDHGHVLLQEDLVHDLLDR